MHNPLTQCSKGMPKGTRAPFKIATRAGKIDVQVDQISSGDHHGLISSPSASG